jgi:phenylalanyl-tRNA synthetase beta chain
MSVERVIEKDGETILDIEITTNRPDCASVIGIVREIAAIYNKKFIYKLPILKGQNQKKQYPVNIKVDIKNKRACLNY